MDSAAQTRDSDRWVEQYTHDITYVEHAAGTMHGREEVRAWIWKTMESFDGTRNVLDIAKDAGLNRFVLPAATRRSDDAAVTPQPRTTSPPSVTCRLMSGPGCRPRKSC